MNACISIDTNTLPQSPYIALPPFYTKFEAYEPPQKQGILGLRNITHAVLSSFGLTGLA